MTEITADELYEAIAHGDSEHRAWLREALDAFFAGQPVPPARKAARVSDEQRERIAVHLHETAKDERCEACEVASIILRDDGETIRKLRKADSEAAQYVESVICLRTHFTGNPPYVGWKGLGLALTETLDELDALRRDFGQVTQWIRIHYKGELDHGCNECVGEENCLRPEDNFRCSYHIALAYVKDMVPK